MSTPVSPIPAGYHSINPNLIVKGADKVLAFMKTVFDAKEHHVSRRETGEVWYGDVIIGNSHIMFGQANAQFKACPALIHVYLADVDAAYARALQAGATSVMPLTNQFYGDRGSGVIDQGGNTWWISTHIEDVSPEELALRQKAMVSPSK